MFKNLESLILSLSLFFFHLFTLPLPTHLTFLFPSSGTSFHPYIASQLCSLLVRPPLLSVGTMVCLKSFGIYEIPKFKNKIVFVYCYQQLYIVNKLTFFHEEFIQVAFKGG